MVRISDAEMVVMKVVWLKEEVTSLEIINAVKEHNWNSNTVRTLINRLINKKAIGISKKEGKTYSYVPLIKEHVYKVKKLKELIKQLFNDSYEDYLQCSFEAIDKSELLRLEKMIDEEFEKMK